MNLAILVIGPCKDLKAPSLWLHKHCADMSKLIFSMLAKSDELFYCLYSVLYDYKCEVENLRKKSVPYQMILMSLKTRLAT